jgi:hypothetical protein
MCYRLRTLLILLAIAPPTLAGLWFAGVWLAEDERYFVPLGALLAAAMWTHSRWINR